MKMLKFAFNSHEEETKTFSGYMNTKEFVKWVLAVLCGLLVLVLLVLSTAYVVGSTNSPFLYFNF